VKRILCSCKSLIFNTQEINGAEKKQMRIIFIDYQSRMSIIYITSREAGWIS